MSGCPRCGGEQLKSAPLLFGLELGLRVIAGGRRRYRCSACGWTGRRRRLHRRRSNLPSLSQGRTPTGRAVSLFVFTLIFLVVTGVLAARGCPRGQDGPSDLEKSDRAIPALNQIAGGHGRHSGQARD